MLSTENNNKDMIKMIDMTKKEKGCSKGRHFYSYSQHGAFEHTPCGTAR